MKHCEKCGAEVRHHDPQLKTCRWREQDDGWFETECCSAFEFTVGGPKDNHFRHCPFCAGIIE